jgi:hypothetical protein
MWLPGCCALSFAIQLSPILPHFYGTSQSLRLYNLVPPHGLYFGPVLPAIPANGVLGQVALTVIF